MVTLTANVMGHLNLGPAFAIWGRISRAHTSMIRGNRGTAWYQICNCSSTGKFGNLVKDIPKRFKGSGRLCVGSLSLIWGWSSNIKF